MFNKNSICCFNKCIDCEEHDKCAKCGWNPEVAAKRIKDWKAEQKQKEVWEGK